MAIPTPPRSVTKPAKFMKSAHKLPYYEDFYGQRNEDEEFDRFPDSCEDEVDSDGLTGGPKMKGASQYDFFAKFTRPRARKPVFKGFGEGDVNGAADQKKFNNHDNVTTSPFNNTNNHTIVLPTASKYSTLPNSDQSKKLSPKKYGMFSSPDATLRGGDSRSNTAGEAMDDLLMESGLDDVDDDFPTLQRDVSGAEENALARVESPERAVESFVRLAEEKARRLAPLAGEEDEDGDGDVEDNDGLSEDFQGDGVKSEGKALKPRGRPKGGKAATNRDGSRTMSKTASPALGARTSGRVQKVASASPATDRYSTRHREKLAKVKKEEERLAKRPATRSMSMTKAAVLKASNRHKMTARAATMKKKAKKITPTKTMWPQGYSKRYLKLSKVLRNWKGKKMVEGNAYVLILRDEWADIGKYVPYE